MINFSNSFAILFLLIGSSLSLSAQFGFFQVIEIQENGQVLPVNNLSDIEPLFSDYEYCMILEYDEISTIGPDVIDPNTVDLTVNPESNAIVVTAEPQVINDNQIEFCFMPNSSSFQFTISADDDNQFTFGSTALFRTLDINVCIVPTTCNDGQCTNDEAFSFNRQNCTCEVIDEICVIPTLGQWGLMSCFLLLLIVGVNEQKEKTKVQKQIRL